MVGRQLLTIGILFTVILPACSDMSTSSNDRMAPTANEDYAGDGDYYPAGIEEGENSEEYEPVGTNPFVVVSHDPFSTFAADVDTASYDIFRRDIEGGRLPDPDSVRLEEFINYFRYDYPAPRPDDAHPFSISLAAAPNILQRETALLRVGIQAEQPPEKGPANLVFLIDVSGSMIDATKLPLVKQILISTLDVLDPTDTVSIVTYASDTGVRLPPTPVADRETIIEEIDSLSAGGSTSGASGISLAYQQAEAAFIDGGINHVLLCTDGDFNVGPSTDEELVALIEEKRATGITLTVLGFGYGNLNDSMMEKVSNAGNGIYAVIGSEEQAARYVEERMLASLHHVAKDMKIQVEFNPEHVYAYRLLGYENRAIADEDFRNDSVDAGEVGAGHRVTALYELVLAGDAIPEVSGAPEIQQGDAVAGEREIDPGDMVLVKVRYKEPGTADFAEASEVTARLAPEAMGQKADELDADYQWAVSVAAFAEILKASPYADPDSLPKIRAIVASENWLDRDREEFKELFETAAALLE